MHRRSSTSAVAHSNGGGGRWKFVMRERALTLWHNMSFPLLNRCSFDHDVPISIYGQEFIIRDGPNADEDAAVVSKRISDIYWFCYRHGYSAFAGTCITSDVGWGCMFRSTQMMLARALVCHIKLYELGDDDRKRMERRLLKEFSDHPDAVFSIHNILAQHVQAPEDSNSPTIGPGHWIGPASVSHLACVAIMKASIYIVEKFKVPLVTYVAFDCMIDPVEVDEIVGEPWTPLLLLVPTRLGLHSISEGLQDELKAALSLPQCVGIVGGKTRHSLYFFGYQGDNLLGLDPHRSRAAVDLGAQPPSKEYRASHARKTPLSSVDPSLALGFYCRTREDAEKVFELGRKPIPERLFSLAS